MRYIIAVTMLLVCIGVLVMSSQSECVVVSGDGTVWYSADEGLLQVSGFAWFDKERLYRRFPANPPYKLPEAVDRLANHASGGQVRFRTDSTFLKVRVKLAGGAYMAHMAGTGQAGVDCYTGPIGKMRFIGSAHGNFADDEFESLFFSNAPRQMRDFTLNLPLYQQVKEISVGFDEKAKIEPPQHYLTTKRVILYGTSILHGGCAARPGMSYTNILSRRINLEFINLGFSGNGKGEPEVAKNIALIENPGLYVLDYEANVTPDQLEETLPEFITILRKAHPDVPILVVSKITYGKETLLPSVEEPRLRNLKFQRQIVEKLRKAGDKNIYFVDGSKLLGKDFDDCTVDGVHPTDLGFYRMADGLEKTIRNLAVDYWKKMAGN